MRHVGVRARDVGANMPKLEGTLVLVLASRYLANAARVRALAEPLTERQFWQKPFPYGNSFGHLVLHLTGNLNYYIGAQIAGTGYVRDRPLEFSETTRPSKTEVLEKFDQAMEMVLGAISSETSEDWSKEYTAVGVDARDRFAVVLLCVTHLHHHIGQMMYLGFELKRRD